MVGRCCLPPGGLGGLGVSRHWHRSLWGRRSRRGCCGLTRCHRWFVAPGALAGPTRSGAIMPAVRTRTPALVCRPPHRLITLLLLPAPGRERVFVSNQRLGLALATLLLLAALSRAQPVPGLVHLAVGLKEYDGSPATAVPVEFPVGHSDEPVGGLSWETTGPRWAASPGKRSPPRTAAWREPGSGKPGREVQQLVSARSRQPRPAPPTPSLRADKRRLDELTAVVPRLKQFHELDTEDLKLPRGNSDRTTGPNLASS